MRKTGDDERIASIAPDGPTWSPSWIERVCKMMCDNDGVTITTSSGGWDSGSKVDSVETDANFGCVFHEQQETSYNNNMLIDQLIQQLQDAKQKFGNLKVLVYNVYDGNYYQSVGLQELKMDENGDEDWDINRPVNAIGIAEA